MQAAALVPESEVVLVDVQAAGLEKAQQRASALGLSARVKTWCGPLAKFRPGSFDCGLCLHGCGALTDVALRHCVAARAVFCLVPCCYGELKEPCSRAFRSAPFLDGPAFAHLSRSAEHPGGEVGDDAEVGYVRTGPLPKRAMRALDVDRALWLAEPEQGYRSTLARLVPYAFLPLFASTACVLTAG